MLNELSFALTLTGNNSTGEKLDCKTFLIFCRQCYSSKRLPGTRKLVGYYNFCYIISFPKGSNWITKVASTFHIAGEFVMENQATYSIKLCFVTSIFKIIYCIPSHNCISSEKHKGREDLNLNLFNYFHSN